MRAAAEQNTDASNPPVASTLRSSGRTAQLQTCDPGSFPETTARSFPHAGARQKAASLHALVDIERPNVN